jgi:DNA polymerase III delta prime subunit
MFFKNSYIPKNYEESKLNIDIIQKLKFINKDNFTNLLLYGSNGTGKYILSKMILESLFGKEIYNIKKYKDKPNYFYSLYHYEIYLERNNNKEDLKHFIEDISNQQNIVSNFNNIIIIKNAQNLDLDIKFFIKILMDRNHPIYFILLFNNISNLKPAFKNIFFNIRIPKINKLELKSFIKNICLNEKIYMGDDKQNDLINFTEYNITKIIINLEYYKKSNTFLNYANSKIDKILNLVYEKKNSNILKIREQLYELTAKNINKKKIITYCVKQMLSRIKDDDTKIKFVNEICKIEEKFSVSYKDLIHLEYFFIFIMQYS